MDQHSRVIDCACRDPDNASLQHPDSPGCLFHLYQQILQVLCLHTASGRFCLQTRQLCLDLPEIRSRQKRRHLQRPGGQSLDIEGRQEQLHVLAADCLPG